MKIFIKETFTTPGYPEFKAGEVYNVAPVLGQLCIDRGFATETDGTREDRREHSQAIKGKVKRNNI